jgi:pyruvate formate lyase activating enzyme
VRSSRIHFTAHLQPVLDTLVYVKRETEVGLEITTLLMPTPIATLLRSRAIAMKNGMRHVFTGNVADPASQATYCQQCQTLLIGRDGYEITAWHLTPEGRCDKCGTPCAGVFARSPGKWARNAGRFQWLRRQISDGNDRSDSLRK